jgi:hypothetical protein
MTTAARSLYSQHRRIPLVILPGVDGFRLAFVGGPTLEILAHFRTSEEAQIARGSAAALTAGFRA